MLVVELYRGLFGFVLVVFVISVVSVLIPVFLILWWFPGN